MCLGVQRENGLAPGFSAMLYFPCIFPRPLNSLGNSTFTASSESRLPTSSLATSYSAVAAEYPNNGVVSSSTM